MVILLILGLGAVVLWDRAGKAPTWYDPPDPQRAEVVQAADDVEYNLLAAAQEIRTADEVWAIRVREDHINAWLAARLPEWLAHDGRGGWPASLGTPQVSLEAAGIRLGIPVDEAGAERVMSVRLVPDLRDGTLRFTMDRAWVGQVGLPGAPVSAFLELLREHAGSSFDDPDTRAIIDLLTEERSTDPEVTLADGRRVRLENLRLGDGTLDLSCRTVAE